MKPEHRSKTLLGITRSKAKMFEYDVPSRHHIRITQDPAKLFSLAIGMVGDLAAKINRPSATADELEQLRNELIFSAQFFDAYLESKLDSEIDPYLILIGAAAYYLAGLPGSSKVLAKQLLGNCPDLDGEGLEDLMLWLLDSDLSTPLNEPEKHYNYFTRGITEWMAHFFRTGEGETELIAFADYLRTFTYHHGSSRQLLFADIASAIVRKKMESACWNALPRYSDLPKDAWAPALQKGTFPKELWPAQHLLGQGNILKGESAVIQMPTSAGKTKATELILRSTFLANRTRLAVIVAPFRALCHEISDALTEAFAGEPIDIEELSDSMQADFVFAEFLGLHKVVVVTPEKLVYVLRQDPSLASSVGLAIFDEGHQFDSGSRGVIYELLLTSLRSLLPADAQKILISAVISNAQTIGNWLNGNQNVVTGATLNPTLKSVGFASWHDTIGRIEFVSRENIDQEEFFVPRLINALPLRKKTRERKDRVFPNKWDEKAVGKEIAVFLGLKLASKGAVAIFCGKKDTAMTISEIVVNIFDREVEMRPPAEYSNPEELEKLVFLIDNNLGENSIAARCARRGIFAHHSNTPGGIREAVENAIRLVMFDLWFALQPWRKE